MFHGSDPVVTDLETVTKHWLFRYGGFLKLGTQKMNGLLFQMVKKLDDLLAPYFEKPQYRCKPSGMGERRLWVIASMEQEVFS